MIVLPDINVTSKWRSEDNAQRGESRLSLGMRVIAQQLVEQTRRTRHAITIDSIQPELR